MVSAARQQQGLQNRIVRFNTRLQWFGDQLARGVRLTIRQRLQLAAQLLRDKVVINLSTPVVKIRGRGAGGRFSRTRVDPTSRSRPGEFPRADTTRLMKDIFFDFADDHTAIVGTTLDYGLILETRMGRPFLRRTLLEMQGEITRILTAGIDGAQFGIR